MVKKKVVLIGGGHGLSNLVKGFKNEDIDLSIVVSSLDDGGHTGKIRDEFNFIALGDLRMVLSELIDEKSVLNDVFNYRFDEIHGVKGVNVGNLMLSSLLIKYQDINKVINYFKERENITANIYVSSETPVNLCAMCEGTEIVGESFIGSCEKRIDRLYSKGISVCNPSMIKAIEEADIIVLGPGSLYTSVGAVLCIEEIKEAVFKNDGELFYVCNIMTQNSETLNYNVDDHVEALEKIISRSMDRVLINDGVISEEVIERYKKENSYIVSCDSRKTNYEFYNLVEIIDGKVMHNSNLVKKIILGQ